MLLLSLFFETLMTTRFFSTRSWISKVTGTLTIFALIASMLMPLAIASAQEAPPEETENYTVTIMKYIDGEPATTGSFSMHAVFPGGEGDYDLDADGFNGNPTPYQAITSEMPAGSAYETYENMNDVVGATCDAGKPYALEGYKIGDNEEDALAQEEPQNSASFENLQSDKFVIVMNDDCSTPNTLDTGSITITKYACLEGTTVTRSENGVDGDAPKDCVKQEGKSFGYVHGDQEDANSPYPELSGTVIEPDETTDSNGQLVIDDLSSEGRYLVMETDGNGNKLAYPGSELLGLYCEGDGDQTDNNDNQELTFVPAGGTANCVAYDAVSELPQEPQMCVEEETDVYYSDDETQVDGHDAVGVTKHPAWTTIPGHPTGDPSYGWIWSEPLALDGDNEMSSPVEIKAFTRDFWVAGTPVGATLEIAADNAYSVEVNGNAICADSSDSNYSATDPCIVPSSALQSGNNTLEITVENYDKPDGYTGPNPAGLLYKLEVNDTCDEPVLTSTVTMCKVDDAQPANNLPGWTLMLKGKSIEDITVDATNSAGTNTANPLTAGMSYIAKAVGTWLNQGGANPADAEYSTTDSWATHMDGYTGYSPNILELQINQPSAFGNWGAYNSAHTYVQSFVQGTNGPANFRIYDGSDDVNQDEGWFGDNSGSLDMNISEGYSGITAENGCVTFTDVPYGTYEADEVMQDGWTAVSGTGEAVIDNPEEIITIVNHSTVAPANGAVHIFKFFTDNEDGIQATTENAGGVSFPMITPTYGNAPFTLGPNGWTEGDAPYEASTSEITAGGTYTAYENTSTDLVGESCDEGTPYALAGYSWGTSLANAQAAAISDEAPSFVINGDRYLIVWNEKCNQEEPDMLKVHIYKYVKDGNTTAQVPDNAAGVPQFPMTATWQTANLNGGESSSGSYVLGNNHGGTALQYAADTASMEAPADYTTSEVTNSDSQFLPIGASCTPGKYRLLGYRSSETDLTDAEADELAASAPIFTDLDDDAYVIVVNEKCPSEGSGEETNTSETIVVEAADLETDTINAKTNNSGKWFFYNDETDVIDNALGSFVEGPATAPLGDGSAEISVTGTQRRNIATYQFKDVKLADIDSLSFSTYSKSAGNGSPASERSPYLNFNVDFNNSDTWQKRLVYLPSENGTVVNDAWQSWNAINGGTALWLYSGAMWPAGSVSDGSILGTTARTWTDILADYPNAETRSTDSWFGFRVGEPYNDGFTGDVDKVVIGIQTGLNTDTKTFDFEPTETSNDNNDGGGSHHSSSFTGGEVLGASTGPEGEVLGDSACGPYITSYIKLGANNDVPNVTRLQQFLNQHLGINLAVTGLYDLFSFNAVKAFQVKHASEVLDPWKNTPGGINPNGTGYVYKTTTRWINMIQCPSLNIPQFTTNELN